MILANSEIKITANYRINLYYIDTLYKITIGKNDIFAIEIKKH